MEDRQCEQCQDLFTPMFKDDYACESCREYAAELDRQHRDEGDFDYSMNF